MLGASDKFNKLQTKSANLLNSPKIKRPKTPNDSVEGREGESRRGGGQRGRAGGRERL